MLSRVRGEPAVLGEGEQRLPTVWLVDLHGPDARRESDVVVVVVVNDVAQRHERLVDGEQARRPDADLTRPTCLDDLCPQWWSR